MDGWRREKAWRGVRGEKQGGAHGSNMQPLCHGNAVIEICIGCSDARRGNSPEEATGVDCVSNEMMMQVQSEKGGIWWGGGRKQESK